MLKDANGRAMLLKNGIFRNGGTNKQALVKFYFLTFARFPLRTPEYKSWLVQHSILRSFFLSLGDPQNSETNTTCWKYMEYSLLYYVFSSIQRHHNINKRRVCAVGHGWCGVEQATGIGIDSALFIID